jgi:hypothetical protein
MEKNLNWCLKSIGRSCIIRKRKRQLDQRVRLLLLLIVKRDVFQEVRL